MDYLKPDLAEWYNEVNAIFSLKREVFAEKRSGIWKSYFGKDQTPKTLQSTIDSTGNLYKEEMKLLEDARISILDELKKVALGATKGSKEENAISRAIEDLEGGVKKLYELCCFIISHLDKEDQAFAKPESFRFEAEEILKKKTSKEEKLAELNKAYGEAEGRVDDIAKMVRGKAEEVSRGTGFAVKVNIPVGSFESIVMVVKNNLRKYQLEAEKFIRSLDSDNKVPLDG
ncbi:MAG: hypothetical protein LBI95_02535 [Holosporales bacterium]|nr:hypothetical protein [Holosporales bacterium]